MLRLRRLLAPGGQASPTAPSTSSSSRNGELGACVCALGTQHMRGAREEAPSPAAPFAGRAKRTPTRSGSPAECVGACGRACRLRSHPHAMPPPSRLRVIKSTTAPAAPAASEGPAAAAAPATRETAGASAVPAAQAPPAPAAAPTEAAKTRKNEGAAAAAAAKSGTVSPTFPGPTLPRTASPPLGIDGARKVSPSVVGSSGVRTKGRGGAPGGSWVKGAHHRIARFYIILYICICICICIYVYICIYICIKVPIMQPMPPYISISIPSSYIRIYNFLIYPYIRIYNLLIYPFTYPPYRCHYLFC